MKRRRKNKFLTLAFTLIEMLAVIVILALILVIAIPNIMSAVENAKKEALRDSAYGLIRAAETYATQNIMDVINLSEKRFTIENRKFVGDGLSLDGRLPNKGDILVKSDIKVNIAITDGTWCARKEYTTNKVVITSDVLNCAVKEPTNEKCFVFNSSTATISNYYNYESNSSSNPACPRNVVIPTQINGVLVKNIGEDAFYNKSLTGVIIPEGIINIGTSAFMCNSLVSVSTPTTIETIEVDAFYCNNLLANVTVSAGEIDDYAFYDTPITKLVLEEGVTSIGEDAFIYNKIENLVIPSSVENIGNGAFFDGEIKNLTLKEGVNEIEDYAFQWNKIENITIPSSLTTAGKGVFLDNMLKEIFIPKTLVNFGVGFVSGNATLKKIVVDAQHPSYKSLNNNSIYSKDGKLLFLGTKSMSDNIEPTVTNILSASFLRMGINSVTIPETVVRIGGCAFYDNDIEQIFIPKSVANFDLEYSFFDVWDKSNTDLSIVVDPDNPYFKSVNNAVYSKDGKTLYFSHINMIDNIEPTTEIFGDFSFRWMGLENIVIPNSIKEIETGAFMNNDLMEIEIPNSVEIIGIDAFWDNYLESVTLGNNLKSIGLYAFNTNYLTSIVIPSSVTTIGDYAFYHNKYHNGIDDVTVRYNATNPANRFNSRKSIIGWSRATLKYVSD